MKARATPPSIQFWLFSVNHLPRQTRSTTYARLSTVLQKQLLYECSRNDPLRDLGFFYGDYYTQETTKRSLYKSARVSHMLTNLYTDMSAVRQIWRSLLGKNKSVDKWRSILTDPSSAMLLHQQDKNVNQLQIMLQELFISGRKTFASTITLLTTKICVAENEDEFSYIRTALEVFV